MARVGLVLGAGGFAGLAYHAGVLSALEEATGWDPRRADVIVGTSAGSRVGAFLRAGLSASDLAAVETRTYDRLSDEGKRLLGRVREVPLFAPPATRDLFRRPRLPSVSWPNASSAIPSARRAPS